MYILQQCMDYIYITLAETHAMHGFGKKSSFIIINIHAYTPSNTHMHKEIPYKFNSTRFVITFTYLPSPLHWHPLCVHGTTDLFISLSTALSRKHYYIHVYGIMKYIQRGGAAVHIYILCTPLPLLSLCWNYIRRIRVL